MPKRTIYTRPIDEEVWAWAQWKAEQDRQSLARVVVDALRVYRIAHESIAAENEVER